MRPDQDDLTHLFRRVVACYASGSHQERNADGRPRARNVERCPDQYVGLVNKAGYQLGPSTSDFDVRQPPGERPFNAPPIVMILESPHKSEFPRDGSAGPARGATGTRIRKHLAQAFRCLPLIDNVHRPLILMNAIQHQCSLGQPPKCHRDTVFCLMWDQPRVRIDFSRRLRGYTQDKGALVINACTLGSFKKNGREELWRRVENVIGQTLRRPSDLIIPHPASWIGNHVTIIPRSVRTSPLCLL